MLTLLAIATLTLAPPQDPAPPTEKQIELAVDELETALRGKDEAKKLAAIDAHKDVDAKAVAKVLGRAVKDKSVEVRKSAIEALRWMEHPESLGQLHSMLKSKRSPARGEETLALLIKAIGQHADPSSIDLLSNKVFEGATRDVVRARILGLGNIRSKESVQALMQLMNVARREHVQAYMTHFRLALMVLTETDQGTSQNLWTKWWNKNKKSFKVAEKAPKLPPEEDRYWKTYWGYEYEMARDKRRRKRGSDPEKGR